MTAAQLRKSTKRKGTQRVKNAQRTTVNGIAFDSKREANRYVALIALEKLGYISNLELQPAFPLVGKSGPIMTDSGKSQRVYKADFRYIDWRIGGAWVVEDAKGWATEVYKLKRLSLRRRASRLKKYSCTRYRRRVPGAIH